MTLTAPVTTNPENQKAHSGIPTRVYADDVKAYIQIGQTRDIEKPLVPPPVRERKENLVLWMTICVQLVRGIVPHKEDTNDFLLKTHMYQLSTLPQNSP